MPYTQCLEREVEADCKNEFCFRPFTGNKRTDRKLYKTLEDGLL